MAKRSLVLLIVIVALVTGGSLIAFAYRPAAAVERSLVDLANATTADFAAQLKLENSTSTKQLLGEEGAVDVEISGTWQQADGPDAFSTHVTLTTHTESLSFTIQGQVRLIEDKLFVLIEKTPQAFPALVQLKDQWIAMERGVADESGTQLLISSNMFTNIDRQGTEQFNDEATVHYTATAKEEAIIHLMDGLANILGTSLSEEQLSQIRGGVAQAETVPLELWIKRWSNEIRQLRTTLIVPGGNTMNFTLRINELNQPVTIAVPEGAQTIQEIVAAKQQAEQN